MAVSPLAAALLSGQGGGAGSMLGLDPTMMQAMPDIQLGQGLEQSGLSTGPASPMQALARVAQAAAGSYLQRSAMSNLAKAYASSADSMAQVFPAGTPIGNALRSPNPLVRMAALQQAPKAMLLGTEPYSLAPDQTRYAGSNTIATGNTALPGAIEAGKNPALISRAAGVAAAENPAMIARAGGEAAAKAPYEAGGEGVVQTPSGPKTIPLTAATRANIQPTGAGMTPASAIPPPPVESSNKDQQRAPQLPPGAPGVGGKPLGNAAIEPMVNADTQELKADREKALAGQADMANVRMIQDFMPKVKTGWSADTKLEAGRILKAAGVPDQKINDFLSTDVAAGQVLQKKFVELSAAAARTMGAREPGSVIAMFAKAYPNLGTDPQAVNLQTNALYMDRLRSQHLAEEKTRYLNDSINDVQNTGKYRGLTGFNEQFNKTNPAEYYLHAAESMSGAKEPWARINDPGQQQQIINLIPQGTAFMSPDGKMRIKP